MWLWVVVAWVIFLFPKKDLPTVTTTTTTSEPSKSHTRIHKWAIRRHNALAAFFDQTRTKQGRRRRRRNIWKLYMYIKLRHGLREKVHVERTRNTSVLPLRHSIISCGEQAHYSDFIFSFSGWKIKINKILRFVDFVSIFLFLFFSGKKIKEARPPGHDNKLATRGGSHFISIRIDKSSAQ